MQINYLDQHPQIGVIFGDAQPFSDEGVLGAPYLKAGGYYERLSSSGIGEFPSLAKLFCTSDFFMPTGTIVVRRICVEDVGTFDEDLKMFEDADLWLRLHRRYRIQFLPRVFLARREHSTNSGERRFLYLDDLLKFAERNDLEAHSISSRALLGEAHFQSGRYYLGNGNAKAAQAALLKSLRLGIRPYRLLVFLMALLGPSSYLVLRNVKHAWALRFGRTG